MGSSQSQDRDASKPPDDARSSPDRPLHILIVEDNAYLRKCYKEFLGDLKGIGAIDYAETCDEGCEKVRVISYDLIITDLSLPDATGTEAVERIRPVAQGIPLLVVSGHEDPIRVRAAFDAGADGYVLKGNAREILVGAQMVLKGRQYLTGGLERFR